MIRLISKKLANGVNIKIVKLLN